jgi:hypothetical protein
VQFTIIIVFYHQSRFTKKITLQNGRRKLRSSCGVRVVRARQLLVPSSLQPKSKQRRKQPPARCTETAALKAALRTSPPAS